MFKKRTIVAMLLLGAVAFTASVSAQETKEVKKPKVFVQYFMEANHVSEDFSDLVRQAVIDGLNKTQRFEIVDQEAIISNEVETDEVQNYTIKGDVLACTVTEKIRDGKREYFCDMSYSISVIYPVTSTTVATKKFDRTGGGLLFSGAETADKARLNSLTLIASDMKDFLINEFPLEGNMVMMDYEVKKDKMITCYIGLGSGLGVKEGDYFVLMVPTVRAGRATYSELGKLKVTEVIDETLSFCKVTSKSKEIFAAVNAYLALDEETQKKQPIKVKSTTGPIIDL